MKWRGGRSRVSRDRHKHLLCHIQARVNVGSFVAASSSGPAGSIRMEADGGQFDGTRPDQAGPEKDGKPLHSAGGLARPDGPVSRNTASMWAPNSCFRRWGVALLSRERRLTLAPSCSTPFGGIHSPSELSQDGVSPVFNPSRQKGNRFQSLKHPARHPSNER